MFLSGVYDFFHSISCFWIFIKNPEYYIFIKDILFYNLIFWIFEEILYYNYIIFNYWWIRVITILLWTIPNYMILSFYNYSKVNQLAYKYFNPDKKSSHYERISEYLTHKFYYILIFYIINLQKILLNYIPYIGSIINILIESLLFSFYIWELNWQFYKIPYISRYYIFEKNIVYFLGFGITIGFIKQLMGFLRTTILINIIHPIITCKTISYDYKLDYVLDTKNVFYLKSTISTSTKILNILVNFINKYYN